MALGLLIKREAQGLARSRRVGRDRVVGVLLVVGVVAGCVVFWDRFGWERGSRPAQARLAQLQFALAAFTLACVAIALVVQQVAPAIATDRDRKRLDALLATRLASAEIVLGSMLAGLLRAASGVAAAVPVVVVLAYHAGIGWRLVLISVAAIATTALAAAAFSVAASVVAATRTRAQSIGIGFIFAWLTAPYSFLILKSFFWRGSPQWVSDALLLLLDSSPIGVGMSFVVGAAPRPGGVVERLLWMMALETAGTLALVAWATWQLRPASRALHDFGDQTAQMRLLRLAARRRPRTPCGDDPVLWNALAACRPLTAAALFERRISGLCWLCVVAVATSWFAAPAFRELAERGYGAAPEAFTMPDQEPFTRVIVEHLYTHSGGAAPGQARLEFNVALRYFTAFCAVFLAIGIMANAAAGVETERQRETWLSLLATPLGAWEIVRAKMLGPVLRSRSCFGLLLALWTLGLLAGSVHPLGFLAAVVCVATIAWFSTACGVAQVIREKEGLTVSRSRPDEGDPASRSQAVRRAQRSAAGKLGAFSVTILVTLVAIVLIPLAPTLLAWFSLLTYEDVHAIAHGGPFPHLTGTSLSTALSARAAITLWLAGTATVASLAFHLTFRLRRDFDTHVGRPRREEDAGRMEGCGGRGLGDSQQASLKEPRTQ